MAVLNWEVYGKVPEGSPQPLWCVIGRHSRDQNRHSYYVSALRKHAPGSIGRVPAPELAQGDRDEGRREDWLTAAERGELNHLRREKRLLKLEREILSNQRGSGPPVV